MNSGRPLPTPLSRPPPLAPLPTLCPAPLHAPEARMLVLAVHGSAVPEAGATIARLADRLTAITGARPVVGHLDVQQPRLGDVLAQHPGAVVVPVLLGDGYHRKVDIPAVARAYDCTVAEGLSAERDVTLAVHARLREAQAPLGEQADAIVVAGAGSTRPGGNDGTLAVAEGLRELLEVPVVAAYCSATEPTVEQAVERLRAQGHRRIAIAAHLLAPGRFTHALAKCGAWAVSAPVADHPRIARLVAGRYAAHGAGVTADECGLRGPSPVGSG
ncbi:sirohydrochlorin chelatase [Streptomyces sp. NPDC051561]|uniref:sirohydrochlorin chelatase n=1 Tax=Streptomyces sp. NPDC051561 TaxID=3365658 RepID=UPI0037A06BA1